MPARSQCNRRIARGPPGRTLRRMTGSLGSGLEDLAKGVGAERGARRFTRVHDLVTRLKPGLLLPLRDQGPGRVAEPEQSLVEAIYQGSARRGIIFLDECPAHGRTGAVTTLRCLRQRN